MGRSGDALPRESAVRAANVISQRSRAGVIIATIIACHMITP